jgi:hypothetical protein
MNSTRQRFRVRWWQFSLRTFLIVVAVFGTWLGVQGNRASRQRRIVAELRQANWVVFYDDYDQFGHDDSDLVSPWLHRAFGLDFFADVVEVRPQSIIDYSLNRGDEWLDVWDGFPEMAEPCDPNLVVDRLAELPRVSVLRLDTLRVTDSTVKRLVAVSTLRDLGVSGTQITDAALPHLAQMSELRRLNISQNGITDAGLEYLRVLRNLELLIVKGTDVTKAGVAQLQQALPRCLIRSGGRRRTW